MYSKKNFYMMYIHKRHILRPTNMGYWFQKKSKFEQNSLFVVLCLLCAHHTTYFVRKQKFYDVLRYLYYHSIWSCTILIKWRQEIRKCYRIFFFQNMRVFNVLWTCFFFQKHAGFQRTFEYAFLKAPWYLLPSCNHAGVRYDQTLLQISTYDILCLFSHK